MDPFDVLFWVSENRIVKNFIRVSLISGKPIHAVFDLILNLFDRLGQGLTSFFSFHIYQKDTHRFSGNIKITLLCQILEYLVLIIFHSVSILTWKLSLEAPSPALSRKNHRLKNLILIPTHDLFVVEQDPSDSLFSHLGVFVNQSIAVKRQVVSVLDLWEFLVEYEHGRDENADLQPSCQPLFSFCRRLVPSLAMKSSNQLIDIVGFKVFGFFAQHQKVLVELRSDTNWWLVHISIINMPKGPPSCPPTVELFDSLFDVCNQLGSFVSLEHAWLARNLLPHHCWNLVLKLQLVHFKGFWKFKDLLKVFHEFVEKVSEVFAKLFHLT